MMMKEKKYEVLTKYLDYFNPDNDCSQWIFDHQSKGTQDDPIQAPFINYKPFIYDFITEFHHSPLIDQDYIEHLRDKNLQSLSNEEIKHLSEKELLTLLTWIIRGERFCDGLIAAKIRNRTFQAVLLALAAFDNQVQ